MENDFITDFIILSVSDEILRRGKSLYKKGVVRILSDDGSTLKAQVRGKGGIYHTSIYNYDSIDIHGECSCPYNWGGYCKHVIALGYTAVNQTETITLPTLTLKTKKKKRKRDQALLLEGFEKMGPAFVQHYLNKYSTWPMPKINRIDFLEGGGLLYDYIREYVYNVKKHTIKLYREKDGYYIHCSCGDFSDEICPYESYTLTTIYKQEIRDFQHFLLPDALKEITNQSIKQFDLPEKYNSSNNFDIYLNSSLQLIVTPRNELDGFRTVQHPYFNDLIEKLNTTNSGHYKQLHNKKSNVYGLGFHISKNHDGTIIISPIEGKLSKDQSRYVSGLEYFEEVSSDSFDISENESQAILLCQQLSASGYKSMGSTEAEDLYRLNLIHKCFKLLEKHPRVFISRDGDTELKRTNLENIRIHPEPVALTVNIDQSLDFIELNIQASNAYINFPLSDAAKDLKYLLRYQGVLYAIQSVADLNLISKDVFHNKIKFPNQQKEALKSGLLPALAKYHTITFPEDNPLELYGINIKSIKKHLYIDESDSHLFFTPVIEYNSKYKVHVLSASTVMDEYMGATQILERDKDTEQEFIDFITSLHPDWLSQKDYQEGFALSTDQVLENGWFFDCFTKLKQKNIEVLGLKNLKKFRYSPHRAKVSMNIRSGQDWFEADVACAFGNENISLKDLQKVIKNEQKYIELSDGHMGMLPEEWIQKLKKILLHSKISDNKFHISKLKFSIIDDLFDKIDNQEIIEEIATKRQKLSLFENISDVEIPQIIDADLRDYQKQGLNWMNFLDEFSFGGILADDMGLGKTLQVLSFMAMRKEKGSGNNLIVVPTSLIFNWENEIHKFCPSLSYLVYHSNGRQKDHLQFKDYDLVITSYGILTRDIKLFQKHRFDYIVLDESQAIKNPASQRYKAACLLKGNHRLTMTGTPIENNTFDLFAQMSFVNPGLLGTATGFRKQFSNPIDKDRNPFVAKELQKIINPFIIRRTKEQVATELPDKTEDVIYCTMESEQRKIYDAYRNKYRDYLLKKIKADGIEKSKIYILEGLTKLRQICDSPQLLKDETFENHSIKIAEILRHIKTKTANHKIIVFSQFVSMLNLIENELIKETISYAYLDGGTSVKQRQKAVDNFQTNESCRVFLISIKAGGTGLNLTAADYVYLMDPWWNPAVENQAIDRCYRIGQDKKVFAYRMICKDTIEDKIIQLQQKKKEIASEIIQTEDNLIKNIDTGDLEELFG
ncbi:MAG: DEAD/DEAH box helicase family protein [Bacteroidales bacterium]|nr:DEAD/DEAH box helicase family protein [Bacteroidales bacterium]